MDDTAISDGTTPTSQTNWLAPGVESFSVLPRTPFMTYHASAGGVVSTTADLLEWGEALYGGHLLSDEMNEELHTLHQAVGASGVDRYGLGVEGRCPCDDSTNPPTVSVLGHVGWILGLTTTRVAYEVDSGVTISFRVNSSDVSVGEDDPLIADLIALALIDGS